MLPNNKKGRKMQKNDSATTQISTKSNLSTNATKSQEVLKYEAGNAKTTYLGTDYNLKLLMHFAWNMYLELKKNSSDKNARKEFRLANEMVEAGKFDDVILHYSKDGSLKYRMLQAKHKNVVTENNKITIDNLQSKDKVFGLKLYCETYIKVTKNNRFRNAEIEDIILCTNNTFDPSVMSSEFGNMLEPLQNEDQFFKSGNRFVFCKDKKKRGAVFSMLQEHVLKNNLEKDPKTRETKVEDFLDKLVLAIDQPSVDELTDDLKAEICKYFPDNTIVYDEFQGYMYNWMISCNVESSGNKFKRESEFLTFSKLNDLFIEVEGHAAYSKLKCIHDQFENLTFVFKHNNADIVEARKFVESSAKRILVLCEENTILGLKKIQQSLENEVEDNCIFVYTSWINSKERKNIVIKAFKRKVTKFIVMVDDFDGSLSFKVMETVNECFTISENKKIILILKPENAKMIEQNFDEEQIFIGNFDRTSSLNDLTSESKQVILNKNIIFQGNETKLGVLIENDALGTQIKDELLFKFSNNNKMEFGNPLESLEQFFIDRMLNVPETENIIITELKRAIDIQDNLFLISAEAGVGKSTLLTSLALDLKQQNPSWWILKINLTEHSNELDQWDENDAHSFVLKMAKLNTELEKCIFNTRLNETGKIVILIDGFDEISLFYKQKMIKIINALKACKLEKLCVTSRPHMKSFLENKLNLKTYTLEPFNESDRRNFLLKFWTEILRINNEARLKKYIDCLLKVFFRSFRDSSFSGTPLHIKMLAEEFQNSVKQFVDSNDTEPSLPPRLNIFSLYQKFVDEKIKIYLAEKSKIPLTNQAFEYVFRQLKENMEEKMKYFALLGTLFPKEAHSWMDEIKHNTSAEDIVEIGLLKSNDRTEFIHRTFAEYFAALWFARETNWRISEVNTFIKNTIFSIENVTIRTFLDYALADQEIHKAILSCDSSRVLELLEKDTGVVACKDRAGRTPLHLACAYGYEEISKMLLDKSANVEVTDEILSWTPLTYAATVGNWNVTKQILIKRGLFDKLIDDIFEVYLVKSKSTPLLHSAAINGNLEFINLLIDEKVSVCMKDENDRTVLHAAAGHFIIINYFFRNVNSKDFDEMMNSRDAFGKTPLHLAVECCNFNAIKFFVERGANVSATDNHGRSIMHIAANKCDIDTMKYLIEHEANIFVLDENNRTPLHYVENDAMFKISLLIDNVIRENRREFVCTKDDYGITGCQAVFKNISTIDRTNHNFLRDLLSKYFKKYEELKDIWEGQGENPFFFPDSINRIDVCNMTLVDDIGDTSQFLAVKNGDWDTLDNWRKNSDQNIIRQSLRSTDIDGKTMLHHAFKNYSCKILSFLLTGIDIHAKDRSGKTPLHVAVMQCNLNPIKHLIEYANSYDILALDNIDFTPVHFAVYNGNLEIMECLIEKLSEEEQRKVICYRDKDGRTLIHLAFEKNYEKEIADWLLDRGANIFAEDNNNNTALDYAVFTNNLEAVKHILTHVKKINPGKVEKIILQQNEPVSPFILAVEKGFLSIIQYFGQVIETEKLKQYVQTRLYDGRFILHWVFKITCKYNSNIVDWLIKAGADIFCKDRVGDTPLMAAVNAKNLAAVENLIEHIKNFGQETVEDQILSLNTTGNSPLSLSLGFTIPKINDYLLKIMRKERFVEMVKNDKNISCELLFYYTALKKTAIVCQLITDGVDVLHKSNISETILHGAAYYNNFDAIEVIIEHIKHNNKQEILDEFIISENCHSWTAFHRTIDKRNIEIAKYLAMNLTENKRNNLMNCQCDDGSTPLHLAIVCGNNMQFIEWLISEGANIFAENDKHETVLHLAVKREKLFIYFLNLLKRKGADYLNRLILKQSNDNCTVLHSLFNQSDFRFDDNSVMSMISILDELVDDATIKDIINIRDNKNMTALCYAAKAYSIRAAEWLLSKGASFLNANNCDTALHIASREGNTDLVKLIVEFVKQNHPDKMEDLMLARNYSVLTPFLLAIIENKWIVAHYLIKSISSELAYRLFMIPDIVNRFPIHFIFGKFDEYLAEWSLKTDIRVKDSYERTVLHSAVSDGKLVSVKFFIENIKKANEPITDWFILSKDTEGDTPIHLAIKYNRVIIVEYLFANISKHTLKMLLDSKNKRGKTILHLALENCGKSIVEIIIQAGADIFCKDVSNNTCLHFAFTNLDLDCCAYFLEYFKFKVHDWKEWVYAKNLIGNTLLHMATSINNFRNFQYILQYLNIEELLKLINDRNYEGRSALFFAVSNSDIEFAEYLLISGADAFIKDFSNTTVLHEIKNSDMTKLLIDHIVKEYGSDKLVDLILTRNQFGLNVFHQFFERDPSFAKLLVKELSADQVETIVNSRRSNGMTAFHMCFMHMFVGLYKWLIRKGVDVFAKDDSGRTALHIIATEKNPKIAIELLNYVINNARDRYEEFVFAEDNEGNNFVNMVLEWNNFKVISYLVETLQGRSLRMMLNNMNLHGESILQHVFANFNRKLAEWLIENGASIFITNSENETLLHISVRNRNIEGMQYLIECIGDSVKFTEMVLTKTNTEGCTVLHYAVYERRYEMVKCLIENTDQSRVAELVNCSNNNGQSAFHFAVMKFHARIVDFLLKKGANYCCKDKHGRNILHYVVYFRFFHVMQELFVILNQRDSEAFNKLAYLSDYCAKIPFHEAVLNCQYDIAEFLIEHMDSTIFRKFMNPLNGELVFSN